MTLTKADLTRGVQRRSPLPCNRVTFLIETFLEIIKKTLETGQNIRASRLSDSI